LSLTPDSVQKHNDFVHIPSLEISEILSQIIKLGYESLETMGTASVALLTPRYGLRSGEDQGAFFIIV
jgi:hypothetical protein